MTRRTPPSLMTLLAASTLLAAAASCVFATPSTKAPQTVSTQATEPPSPPEPVEPIDRRDEERLLRSLFELQMKIARTTDRAQRDSLQTVYESMVQRVNELGMRRSETEARREERVQRAEELIGELSREFQGNDIDWEEVADSFDQGMKGLGAGLEQLGEMLQDFEVNVEGDEFQFEDGQGSRITVPLRLPPEVHDQVAKGLRDFMDALEESTGHDIMGELRKIVPPDAVAKWARRDPRRERPRRVVAQSVFRFTEAFDLAENEVVQGDVIIIGADCNIAGEVQGNAYILLGDLTLEDTGVVGKDAVSIGGEVVLEGSSSVHGKMFDISNVAPGFLAGPWTGFGSGVAVPMHGIRVAVLALLLVIGFALAGDRFTLVSRHTASFPLKNLLSGSIYLLAAVGGFAVVSLGLAITVIGIPVAIVLAVAFAGLLLAAYFVACQVLGTRLLAMMGGQKPHAMWAAGLLGLAILEIPAFLGASMPHAGGADASLPLQVLDYVLKFVALSIGLGSLVATRLGSRHVQPAPSFPLSVEEATHNPT